MFFRRPQSAFGEAQDRTLHYEHHNCGAGWRGSCRCPQPSLPTACPPAGCGGALGQIWEINWFKALLELFSWAYFTTGQRRKGREGWRTTSISTIAWCITRDRAPSAVCMLEAEPWSSAHGQKGNHFPLHKGAKRRLAWRWTERLLLGILQGHRICRCSQNAIWSLHR